MVVVVGKDMATGRFTRTFAYINLDDINDASPNFEIEENEEVRTKVSSFARGSKHKRKNIQESVDDENIQLMTKQLGEIASAIKKINEDKIIPSHLFGEIMSIERFDEESLSNTFDYLMEHKQQAKAFLAKTKNLKKT
ncbi:hypothetical protein Gogos_003510 [Gossypium gossypioides]|uniref:Uncharacterized protein n=1 Tax=Gossypium gossypioides TaxID=34282 RepID=A0A7J9CM93_GOSGO|nr:hypothetical protein [Gossypium gossypioides]